MLAAPSRQPSASTTGWRMRHSSMASHLEALRADLPAKVAAPAAGKRRNLYTPGGGGLSSVLVRLLYDVRRGDAGFH